MNWLFERTLWPPRWHCGEWSEGLGWTAIAGHLVIFASYMVIPWLLWWYALRSENSLLGREHYPVVALCAGFILFCGIGHFLEALIFWVPVYRLSTANHAVTAAVSAATAVSLLWVMPRTRRHLLEQRARAGQFEQAYERAGVGMASVHMATGTIQRANPALCAFLEMEREQLEGLHLADVSHPADMAKDAALIQQVLAGELEHYSFPKRYHPARDKDRVKWGLLPVSAMPSVPGEPPMLLGMLQDIDKQVRFEQDLEQRNQQLEVANEEIKVFTAALAHDLKTPLRTIRGSLEQATFQVADPWEGLLYRSLEQMDQLLDDVALYHRVDATPAERAELCDMGHLVRHVARSFPGLALHIETDLPALHGDPTRLKMVLRNLLDNACKYNQSEQPTAWVQCAGDGPLWHVSLRDNGIGIAPRHHTKFFGTYERGHAQHEYPGSGFGLAICKKIIESAGGRIWVESEGEGSGGSTFHFTLPREAQDPATEIHTHTATQTTREVFG